MDQRAIRLSTLHIYSEFNSAADLRNSEGAAESHDMRCDPGGGRRGSPRSGLISESNTFFGVTQSRPGARPSLSLVFFHESRFHRHRSQMSRGELFTGSQSSRGRQSRKPYYILGQAALKLTATAATAKARRQTHLATFPRRDNGASGAHQFAGM